ncbi:enoyl-CoA hydratase-related protein [Flavobacteriaceae bacterium]|jgi:methylglutaconyl-CoA hydratase|nr:enoyl-CoA hydratase/isomerase family protein [Flavobacteriaceae bacterium]MDA9124417.1 enoyl-CoA hydratase-related protein [bacterium]MBT4312890.1 enoyl-CoA hydratase/isomerase family protein [Flavobacteriaceae bacterium]MBT5091897.1 enoyl-CoA hydratase/isomerase family protein [Flavobacteriaceae bacterium]MBT5282513.1 enoyl-CoA hydratase/isomerase family protein [Flavobacteriaceae bacterium]
MEAYVKNYCEGNIGFLEFGNPAGNSLPSPLLKAFKAGLIALEKDSNVRVIVIQSFGDRAFCGGASLAEMKTLQTLEEATAFFMGIADLINTLRSLSKFVIGRVHGKVVGGGVGLVAACDYVLANRTAQIKLSELSIGIGPYVIEPVVSRKIGGTAFAQLSLDAHQWKSATWAEDKGLYHALFETQVELDLAVKTNAERFASYPEKAVKTLRKLHWKETEHWDKLLPKNAAITGELALQEATQNILKKL